MDRNRQFAGIAGTVFLPNSVLKYPSKSPLQFRRFFYVCVTLCKILKHEHRVANNMIRHNVVWSQSEILFSVQDRAL